MLKFLRKYNKIILVIGGALLMVAFLMPQAIQQLGQDQSGREYMRIAGRKVTEGEAAAVERRRFVVRQTVPIVLARLGIEDSTEHWLMLTHEANRHGLIGGLQDGRDFIGDLSQVMALFMVQQEFGDSAQMILQQFASQVLPPRQEAAEQMLEAARVNLGVRPEEFDQALAELHGIWRLRQLYDSGPGRISDRRAILEGLRMHNAATVDYVFIPAESAIEQVPQPDDQALAEHLERFKDVRPVEGDFGIGYNLPPRVKLEWLVLDREAIGAAVRVDRVELAQQYIRENPGAPASGPEFDAARVALEERLRKEATDRIMAEADQAIRAEFARATRRLDSQGPYRILPENWAEFRPDLQTVRDAVVERVKAQTGRTITAPAVTTMDSAWLTADELRNIAGIGSSTITRGGRTIPFPAAALSVKELGDPFDLGIQVDVPGAVSTDIAGNQYYFTVLDAKPESAPESVDEIRDRLVNDYRRLEAFKILQREADVYRQRAVNEGLAALATPPSPMLEGMPMPAALPEFRRGATVSRVGDVQAHAALNQESIRSEIVAAAERLDPTVDAATLDVETRTLALPAPKRLGLVVAQIQSFRPLTSETYRLMDRGLVQQMELDASTNVEEDPFSVERMAERLNAKLPATRGGRES